ncbi:ATP-dependent endonuclease [Veillonella sp. AS16]|uniref:ATP-dependent nuclease n=1 Tax=Veillonella sp. AS16 TaxID=936589 RepID=UPI0003E25616|nr:AAA family ATPase [Veillonella sp. AS16]ETS93368.1 PF11398 family protein [Veillonella sp. AS16]
MRFSSIRIKNFRNFEDIDIKLSNKNIIFGLNDVGKTNFLYALRFLFDRNIRKNGFIDSDFYQKNTENDIEIVVEVDLSDIENDASKLIRSIVKGALRSGDGSLYIKLKASYNYQLQYGEPQLMWAGNEMNYESVKQIGSFTDLDKIFNVIYIDAYVNLQELFSRSLRYILPDASEADADIQKLIDGDIKSLNEHISSLSNIKSIEEELTPLFNSYQGKEHKISLKSEVSVNGYYSNLTPYIEGADSNGVYPTAGEGRRKLLAYALYKLLMKKDEGKKINLFLLEEPENHLHKGMQLSLSSVIFNDNTYEYLFVTTHSPFILYEMNNVNLVRIYNLGNISSKSFIYKVPTEFEKSRKLLNSYLAEAIFANRVLLVEGPSEELLFNKVLLSVKPNYEALGLYILSIRGIYFNKFIDVLQPLGIICIIKTDNDINAIKNKKSQYMPAGFKRCNKLLKKTLLPEETLSSKSINQRKKLYRDNIDKIKEMNNLNIFISEVDLEHDLQATLKLKHFKELVGHKNPVKYLQEKKQTYMVDFIHRLEEEDCKKILKSSYFSCLKALLNE